MTAHANTVLPTMSVNIYQNILSTADDRADLCVLDSKKEKTAQGFVADILQYGRLDFELHSTFQAANLLQHLFFEARNQEKKSGDKMLGFGFPTLFTQIEGENYAAPLFIWRLGMEASANRINSWVFRHNDSYPVEVNLHLMDALQREYDTDFSDVLLDFGANDRLNKVDLQRICARLSNRLNLAFYQADVDIMPHPASLEVRKLLTDGGIHWSGSIGLFEPQWKMEQLPEVVEQIDWEQDVEITPPAHSLSLTTLTPGQAAVAKIVQTRQITQVSTLHINDQNDFINHLIINALANGEKCLVVGKYANTLHQIQEQLVRQKIQYLHFILKEPVTDKSLLLELLKALDSNEIIPLAEPPARYAALLEKATQRNITLDANYAAIQRAVFGNENWSHLVGHFLRSNRTEGKELLHNQLQATDFAFTSKEYQNLRTAVELCKPLYQNISTLKHPLGELNADIFTQKTEEEGLRFIQEKTAYFLKKGKDLQLEYINGQAAYSKRLRAHYEKRHDDLLMKANQLLEAIDSQRKAFGTDFKNASVWSLKLKGLVSGRSTRIIESREDIQLKYDRLQQLFEQYNYFDFSFAKLSQPVNINRIQQQTNQFVKALKQWKLQINGEVQEEVKRLSFQTALPSIEYRHELKTLEDQLDELVHEINDARLLEDKLTNKMLTLNKQQRFLEAILEQMEGTRYNLRDFNSFYKWHRNWLQLDIQARKVVQALIKVQPNIWIAAFESWYFNQILTLHYTPELPDNNEELLNFTETLKEFRPLLLEHLNYIWQERRKRAIKNLKSSQKKTYQLIFGKKNHELCAERSLQEILRLGLPTISEVLPVLLTTVDVAVHDLPRLSQQFDTIIFTNSEALDWQHCEPLLAMGRRIVAVNQQVDNQLVSGSSLQDKLDQQSILNLPISTPPVGEILGAKRFFNCLFNPNFELSLIEEAADPMSLQVINVEGRYNEKEATNDAEAQHILTLLNGIKITRQRTYPKVGIICFTKEQRNLIAAYLLKIKQKRSGGSDMIQHLERNGLSVLHIDELIGQEFDIVISSLVYGTVDMHGTFTREMGELNQKNGWGWLKSWLGAAKKKLVIVNSIPNLQRERFIQTEAEHVTGIYLLMHLLNYAKAVQRNRSELQFKQLLELYPEDDAAPLDLVLAEEVSAAILPYLGVERLARNVVFNGLRIPLLILPLQDNQPAIAVVPDGFFAKNATTSYDWERLQQQKLEELDFLYYPAWSVLWWKDPAQEARKLASWVIKMDKLTQEV